MCTAVNSMLIHLAFRAASPLVWTGVDNSVSFPHLLHTVVRMYTAVFPVFHMVMHMSTPNISISVSL